MPARFRTKPCEIDAHPIPIKWDGETVPQDLADLCIWLQSNAADFEYSEDGGIDIVTLEGKMHGRPGDWIIRGLKGEFYPCKPDVFVQKYEPVYATAEAEHGSEK